MQDVKYKNESKDYSFVLKFHTEAYKMHQPPRGIPPGCESWEWLCLMSYVIITLLRVSFNLWREECQDKNETEATTECRRDSKCTAWWRVKSMKNSWILIYSRPFANKKHDFDDLRADDTHYVHYSLYAFYVVALWWSYVIAWSALICTPYLRLVSVIYHNTFFLFLPLFSRESKYMWWKTARLTRAMKCWLDRKGLFCYKSVFTVQSFRNEFEENFRNIALSFLAFS